MIGAEERALHERLVEIERQVWEEQKHGHATLRVLAFFTFISVGVLSFSLDTLWFLVPAGGLLLLDLVVTGWSRIRLRRERRRLEGQIRSIVRREREPIPGLDLSAAPLDLHETRDEPSPHE